MIVYKLCHKRMASYISIAYSHIGSKLTVDYAIGKKSFGVCGPLFAYATFERAVSEIGKNRTNYYILECYAQVSNSKVKEVPNPIELDYSEIVLFWKNPSRSLMAIKNNRVGSCTSFVLDDEVVLCKSITPTRLVMSEFINYINIE